MRSASQWRGPPGPYGDSRPIDVKVHRIRRASAVPMDPSSMRPALPAGGCSKTWQAFGTGAMYPERRGLSVRGSSGKIRSDLFLFGGGEGRVGRQCPEEGAE